MEQKLSQNSHDNHDRAKKISTDTEQARDASPGAEEERKGVDKIPLAMNALSSGKKLKVEKVNALAERIQAISQTEELAVFSQYHFRKMRREVAAHRVYNFKLSERFTIFGIAPAWRNYPRPEPNSEGSLDEINLKYLSDLRIIDLQWLHAKYRGDVAVFSTATNANYLELMKRESFDYVLAQKVAMATPTSDINTGIADLGLCEDTQRELVAYKTPEIQREQEKITKQRIEVERDLRIAASRNTRMGNKLLSVMNDRVDQWMSTQVTPSKSKSVMYETYKKITGSTIAVSSYNTKLQSLKHALRLAESEFKIY